MANSYSSSVILVDTSAAFIQAKRISSIKYIGSSSGAASIKGAADSSGSLLWEESGTANVYNAEVDIRDAQGVYVTVSNGAKVYLYLET